MIKHQLEQDLKKVVEELGLKTSDTLLSISQNPTFGDYSSNIALQQSNQLSAISYQSSAEIAKKILEKLGKPEYLEKTEIAGPGFLNFFIKPEYIAKQVKEIIKEGEGFGKNNRGDEEEIEVEFISANPTGPLTLANGRGGAIGDTLANVLIASGYKVHREYYVNDTGNQIRLLGESVLAVDGKVEKKENHYQGEYVKELAEKFKEKLSLEPQKTGHMLSDYLLENEIKPALLRLGVKFDEFYSERSIYERGLIDKTVELLKEKRVAYEKDGALWFKSTEFGDEKDRVLMTSDEGRGRKEPTYFLADIAHHLDVLKRGYRKKITILGADHFGYASRIKGAVDALGFEDKVDLIFMQMVKLFRNGQEVRMSKRAGTFVTLDELLDQVSADAARFFFLMYTPDSHIDFNLDLAKERSTKNPVFYVQYAHARMSNILAKAEVSVDGFDTNLLIHTSEVVLVRHLSEFAGLVREIAESYQVHKLTFYTIELADRFHRFYESARVLNAETEELKKSRLALVKAAQIVLRNALMLMGVSAPERM